MSMSSEARKCVDRWIYRGYWIEVFIEDERFRARLIRMTHSDVLLNGAHWLLLSFKTLESVNQAARGWVEKYGVRQ